MTTVTATQAAAFWPGENRFEEIVDAEWIALDGPGGEPLSAAPAVTAFVQRYLTDGVAAPAVRSWVG